MCSNDFRFCLIEPGREWYTSDWIHFRRDGRGGVHSGTEVIIVARFIYYKWLGRSVEDGSDKSARLNYWTWGPFLESPGKLNGHEAIYSKIKVITSDCPLLNCHEMKKKKKKKK